MQQGPITTILVHSMLNRQQNLTRRDPMIKMQYEEYNPPNYQNQMNERIRCRSFYLQKPIENELGIRKQRRKNVMEHRSIQTGQMNRQLNKIDVQFETISRSKSKKDAQKAKINPNQYCTIMANSMNNYISKVEKGKRKKLQKCQKIKQFGVNIQAIKTADDFQQKFPPRFKRKDWSLIKDNRNITPSHQNSESKLSNLQISEKQSKIINKSEIISKESSIFASTISGSSSLKKTKFFSKKVIYKLQKQENTVGNKLNKMLASFSVILNSFGVRIDRPIIKQAEEFPKLKKPQKYTYYIGKGNNKNLLISLLKKRWWWAEAEDMASASFVWTQLKVTTILQKQPSMFYSSLDDADPSVFRTQKENPSTPKHPYSSLFHKNFSNKFYHKMPQKQERKQLRAMMVPCVLHNHYEANYMLGNKKALFYNMSEYKTFKEEELFEYLPLTYHIQKLNSKSFKLFEKKVKQSKKSVWIVKPGQNSNRGQGIFVTDSIEKIKRLIQKDKSHTYIIQKYLKNIFTFQRRKFDIRTYLLMLSIGGVKKFYWYTEGYLRTSSEIYDLTDLDDPYIHLTNDAIQLHGQNYGKFEKGNKVTYHEFQRYLDLNYPAEKYSVTALIEKMKGIAKQVVQATYFKIDPCRKQCGLELFGMDFIIDSNFKPWLLEVNTNPCLQLSGPVLERLIPRMMENLFRIAIDPIFQPSQNSPPRNLACYIPENILERNRFELIFDSLYDRNQLWEQFSMERSQNKVYEDENQQFESDGELIKIDD